MQLAINPGSLCDMTPEVALPYLAMQERQLTLEHEDRERERQHRETVARLEGAAHQATVQLELLRMLPERERGRAAARVLRRADAHTSSLSPAAEGGEGTTGWDWSCECTLAAADSQGLAGVWDSSIAPALGVPAAMGRAMSRCWRPTPGQVQRCFVKLGALREQVQPSGPGAAVTARVMQHLRSLHTPEDTTRVVRDLTACVRACMGSASSQGRPRGGGATKRGLPSMHAADIGEGDPPLSLGTRQTRVVLAVQGHAAFLECLTRIEAPGAVSIYTALRRALPAEYTRALHNTHARYDAILVHLPRPLRHCVVEAPHLSIQHTVHFWDATGEAPNTVRDAVLEYACEADDSLPVHRWFLYRPPEDPDGPLCPPLSLSAFGFQCGDADDWASCLRRSPGAGDPLWSPLRALQQGALTDEWVEVMRRGPFGVLWSALTGPLVCRLVSHQGTGTESPLLPDDESNLPDTADELWALLWCLHERLPVLGFRPASGIYRLPLEGDVKRAWERVMDGVNRASEPSRDQLWLRLHLPHFHPGYRFRFIRGTSRLGLTPQARRACEDYLTGLVWVRKRHPPVPPQGEAAP